MSRLSRALARVALAVMAAALFASLSTAARATCPPSFALGTLAADVDCIFRDYNTDGVFSSGVYQPQKSQIRAWGEKVGSSLVALAGTADVGVLGAVGDGATDNSVAFASAFASVAGGGKLHVPCGTYKITATPAVTIAAGKHVELLGDGSDCTVILVSGAIDGPTFTLASQWSSLRVANLTITTDQTGGTNCLVAKGAYTNAASAYAAGNIVENATFRGADAYGAATQFCGVGFKETDLNNLAIINETFQGIAARNGTAVSLNGSGSGGTYSTQINISHSNFNNCNAGVYYGDWVQGLAVVVSNVTGCNYGVYTAASPAGSLSELNSTGSQYNTFACAICVYATAFPNLQLVNNTFIVEPNSTGVKAQGTNFNVTGNAFGCVNTTGTVAVELGSTFGNGGTLGDNHIAGCAKAYLVDAVAQAQTTLDGGNLVNNTTDYSIAAASRGTFITDIQPRNFVKIPTCNASTAYSSFHIADATTGTFYAAVTTGGGAYSGHVWCDGSTLHFGA